MNLLIDQLPETVTIEGRAWPINSNFFIGILFELLMQDSDLSEEEKVERALALYYPTPPPNLQEAMNQLLWFYRCGKEGEKSGVAAGEQHTYRQPYDFDQDAELIFSAFWAQYHIDLNEIENLHWWKFRALFQGLSTDCEFCKVMGYRTADTKGMSKSQKQFYEKMRKRYALKKETHTAAIVDLAQRDREMKDYVARRFREIGGGGD